MKTTALLLTAAFTGPAWLAVAQIPLAPGNVPGAFSYSQDFDNQLADTGSSNGWTDNTTIPAWYSNRTTYAGSTGTATTGGLFSYGPASSSERALGSLASAGAPTIAFGVQFKNTSGNLAISQITVAYTGEQWRNGGSGTPNPQSLTFAYKVGSGLDLLSPPSGGWVSVPALDFTSPVSSGGSGALNGGLPANQTVISAVLLTGLTLAPGQELFLRWLDINDGGNDHGLAIDNLTVAWVAVPEASPAGALGLVGGLALAGWLHRRCKQP